jgi:hypothetical protein
MIGSGGSICRAVEGGVAKELLVVYITFWDILRTKAAGAEATGGSGNSSKSTGLVADNVMSRWSICICCKSDASPMSSKSISDSQLPEWLGSREEVRRSPGLSFLAMLSVDALGVREPGGGLAFRGGDRSERMLNALLEGDRSGGAAGAFVAAGGEGTGAGGTGPPEAGGVGSLDESGVEPLEDDGRDASGEPALRTESSEKARYRWSEFEARTCDTPAG